VPGRWTAVFDLAALHGRSLRVRSPKAGDRVKPLGLDGTKKLQDVFVDAKVPRAERPEWPVVTAGGVVAWVPGLVRGQEALIREGCRRLLQVRVRRGGR